MSSAFWWALQAFTSDPRWSRRQRSSTPARPPFLSATCCAAAAPGAAGAGRLDRLQQLLLPAPLRPDLRGEAAPPAGVDRIYRNPSGRGHPRGVLAARGALVG